MLQTERLELIPSSIEQLTAIVAGDWPALQSSLGGVGIAEHWYHFPDAFTWMLNYLRRHPDEVKWWNFLIIHRPDHYLVGSCGYKGGPSREGEIEIGYEIADGYWGRGLATEAARALTEHALSLPEVKTVLAHTLAKENASCSVLRKLGFVKKVELFDADDGAIWRWERPKER
jgi:ribosomal-protein-alanine N-acetyltransferase